ncbi:MAG: hypothetical protein Kow00124_20590 [Anaerolineae bacterium]
MTDHLPGPAGGWQGRPSRRLIAGLVLIGLGLLYAVPLLIDLPGAFLRDWRIANAQLVGRGVTLVPVLLGYLGGLLIRDHLAGTNPARAGWAIMQIAGGLLLVVGTLALIHAALLARAPTGVAYLNPAITDPALQRRQAVTCPLEPEHLTARGWEQQEVSLSSMEIARCGHGGGLIGAAVLASTDTLLGADLELPAALLLMTAGVMITVTARLAQHRAAVLDALAD